MPVLNPLWFKYPSDTKTFGIDLQFLYGDSILVSPVTDENATSVNAYFPNDVFYDFTTREVVRGRGANMTLRGIGLTNIPVHIRGGSILPLRVQSAMTTTALRTKNFEFVVAPGLDGAASGRLYVDDGVSIDQLSGSITDLSASFKNGQLDVEGTFGNFTSGLEIQTLSFLGVERRPKGVTVGGKRVDGSKFSYDTKRKVLEVTARIKMVGGFIVNVL